MNYLEAVIFDYGNVLSISPWQSDIETMARIFAVSKDSFESAYWNHRNDYDCGLTTNTQYWSAVGEQLEVEINVSQISELTNIDVRSWARPNKQVVEFAYDLIGRGIQIALLSNMPIDLKNWAVGSSSWLPQLSHQTFSCDLNCVKPDPRIYQHAIYGLGKSPSNILFVDDRIENVEGAVNCGMNAIHFQNFEMFKQGMESILNTPQEKVPAVETFAGTL